MRSCTFINTCYPAFLASHYAAHPALVGASYAEQLDSLNSTNFGDSDFYSSGLRKAGWLATDIVVNCNPLQTAWAREANLRLEGWAVAVEQVRRQKPDVVYVQDLNATPKAFLDAVRDCVGLVVGQIATTVGVSIPLDSYDVIVSSMPHLVDQFRAAGLTAHYLPLAFAPRVAAAAPARSWSERSVEVSFIGGISPVHAQGIALLEVLVRSTPIQLWGYGADSLPPHSILRSRHRGESWGNAMFAQLGDSRISVNRHADYADRFANNMRLFEATGAGALLITDYKDNLDELFAIGEEVVAYRTAEECASLVQYFLGHPGEAERIARAGRARTLRDHTYDIRMTEAAEVLERHLRYRSGHSSSSVRSTPTRTVSAHGGA